MQMRSMLPTVGDAPGRAADCLFWQFPCRTEGTAASRHARLASTERGAERQTYLPLPWATWIDMARLHDLAVFQYGRQLRSLRHLAESNAAELRVHTVCQHIYWRRMLPVWRHLGVTDLWLSHADAQGSHDSSGLVVHPWALHAVNVETPERRIGLPPVVGDPAQRGLLASFIGAHMPHYLSDARLRLRQLADTPGFLVEVHTDKWHFEDVVYRHQVGGAPLEENYVVGDSVRRYNEVLAASRFALCPSGAGPNTLRLWEALAVGAVPVLLGAQPMLPIGGNLPPIDWDAIVVRLTDDKIDQLPQLLAAMPMDEVRCRSRQGLEAYASVRRQTCF